MSNSSYEEILATAAIVAEYLDRQTSDEAGLLRGKLAKCSGLLEDLRISRTAIATANANMAELYVELEEAKEAADAANAAKATFLATMSHELRTPMNGILGMLEVLGTTSLTEPQRDMLGIVRRSGVTLLELLNGVLDYSKIEAQKLELEERDFDLRLLVEDVVSLMGANARTKGVAVTCDIAPGAVVAMRGDQGRVRQILSNLLGNAVKFTAQGHVALSVRVVEAGEGLKVEIDVADTGIGIPADVIPRLFTVFTQQDSSTTRRYGGTGLGLAIAAQLAKLMGGGIHVESEVGKGSVFHVALAMSKAKDPARLAAERRQCDEAANENAPVKRSFPSATRILLAEDNEVNRTVGIAMLEQLGCVVSVAMNGREACVALETRAFDLVFMDCQMPEMDGWEATRAIRAREAARGGRRMPIVALTANAFAQDREACLAAGMDDFMTKPVGLSGLAAALTRWCEVREAEAPVIVEPAAPTDILDPIAIQNLRALRRPGRPDVFARAVQSWSASSGGELLKLRTAVEGGDLEDAKRLSHTLRGGAASLGGKRLAARLAEIERLARSGDQPATARLLEGLDDERAAMLDALRAVA